MSDRAPHDLRALLGIALRLAATGVLGGTIGWATRLAAQGSAGHAVRAIGGRSVRESATRLVATLPVHEPRAAWSVATALVLSLALAIAWIAARRRSHDDDVAGATAPAPDAGAVTTLAAAGATRAEIARRTGMSRDAVALSLHMAARQV